MANNGNEFERMDDTQLVMAALVKLLDYATKDMPHQAGYIKEELKHRATGRGEI